MKKQKKRTLNEEQLAQAQKEAGIANGQVYLVRPKNDPLSKAPKKIIGWTFIEAERFFDVRSFGCLIFGVSEVEITVPPERAVRYPCWQLRWTGTASGEKTLRMQARLLPHGAYGSKIDRSSPPPWCELSEVV